MNETFDAVVLVTDDGWAVLVGYMAARRLAAQDKRTLIVVPSDGAASRLRRQLGTDYISQHLTIQSGEKHE